MRLFKTVLALTSLVCSVAYAESRVGNGGDSMAAEFVEMADDTLTQINKLRSMGEALPLSSGELNNLRDAIEQSTVFSQDRAILDNLEVDAINYPEERKIVLNRARWRSLAYSLKSLKAIVLHEYLTLAGANDRSYQISNKLVRKIFNGGSTPELWYLKDLDDKRFTNPFLSAWLEIDGKKLKPTNGVVMMQQGRVIQKPVANTPFCTLELAQQSLPPTVIKAYVMSADQLTSQTVALDLGKPAIIKRIVCSSGSILIKPTVASMLDSLDANAVVFNHQNSQTCAF